VARARASLLSLVTIQLTHTTLLYGSRVQNFEIAISNGTLPHLDRCISTNLHRPITPPSHFFFLPTLDSLISPNFKSHPPKFFSLSLSHTSHTHIDYCNKETSLMKMAFISETASAIKSRFGFHDHSSKCSSTSSSPDLLKSTSKDNNAAVAHSNSVVRTISNWDEDDTVSIAGSSSTQSFDFDEDPSFWKDHNVQVRNYNW